METIEHLEDSSQVDNQRRTPEQRRSRERVERVLDVAVDLIVAEGIDSITMSKLAEAADVSLPSIYRYFPSKRSILQTLLQRYSDSVRELVMQDQIEVFDEQNVLRFVRDAIGRYLGFVASEPAYSAVWAAGFADPELTQLTSDSVVSIADDLLEKFSLSIALQPEDRDRLVLTIYLITTTARVQQTVSQQMGEAMLDQLVARVIPALFDLDERLERSETLIGSIADTYIGHVNA